MKLEVEWDDRAEAWRIGSYDEAGEWTCLPGATETDHPLYVGACAAGAATDGLARAEHDEVGSLWRVTDDDIKPALLIAAEAATAAMSPLDKAEVSALRELRALGMTTRGAATRSKLQAKHLLDVNGRLTPAGTWRAARELGKR